MRLDITHSLHYRYEPAVFLEPVVARFRPRSDFAHALLAFELAIEPAPAGRAEALDAQGNVVTWAWFDGRHEHLHLEARSSVEVTLTDPFRYLIADPAALALPMRYSPRLTPVLAAYREPDDGDAELTRWAQRLSEQSRHETQPFLMAATQSVYEHCEMIERDVGDAYPPTETMRQASGACRDIAVLFIELCRRVGLAARFVSGYHLFEQIEGKRQLHAWAEVYLPGAGWRGYDPSYGLVVAQEHVAIAAGRLPADAALTEGAFRRTGARSSLDFHIDIERAGGTDGRE